MKNIFLIYTLICAYSFGFSQNVIIETSEKFTEPISTNNTETRIIISSENIDTTQVAPENTAITNINILSSDQYLHNSETRKLVGIESSAIQNNIQKSEFLKSASSPLFKSQEELYEYIKQNNIKPRTIVYD